VIYESTKPHCYDPFNQHFVKLRSKDYKAYYLKFLVLAVLKTIKTLISRPSNLLLELGRVRAVIVVGVQRVTIPGTVQAHGNVM